MSLNPRQKRFAELYHRYGNGTRAYGEAGEVEKTEDGNFPAGSLVIGSSPVSGLRGWAAFFLD